MLPDIHRATAVICATSGLVARAGVWPDDVWQQTLQPHLDEDVADVGAAHGGVAVRPHDPHRLSVQRLVVERLQGALRYRVYSGT